MNSPVPILPVAVWIARTPVPPPWDGWSFQILGVEPDAVDPIDSPYNPTGVEDSRWRCGGLEVALHRDEAEGYFLNLSSGAPVWFVMWRADEQDPSRAQAMRVTLSYHEAGRLLDAQERVDTVPLPTEVQAWLAEFTHMHYRPEPKQRRRPASFKAPQDR